MAQTSKRKFKPTELYSIPADIDLAVPTIAVIDELSHDGRRVKRDRQLCYVPQAGPSSQQPLDDPIRPFIDYPMHSFNDSNEDYTTDEVHHTIINGSVTGRNFSTKVHDPSLQEWVQARQHTLHELLRHEGLASADLTRCKLCPSKRSNPASYQCRDCFTPALMCRMCCIRTHKHSPFHRVKSWNGTFFAKVTLQDLGLIVQLGHTAGARCPAPVAGSRSFAVIHTNGLHGVTIQFCQCSEVNVSGSYVEQLLRAKLFPATLTDPTTAATFDVLEAFHVSTLQSKITAYDFYMSLEKMTDNTGLNVTFNRIKPFFRMVREWRHVKALKRSGRGHELSGVKGTRPGDLVVRCPACPHVNYNLPDNWAEISDDLKFIYTLFVAIDANFRLKRRAKSSEARDPALGSGWGYFVDDGQYRDYIREMTDQKEISTCTGFAALMHANTKWSKGYATTGVAIAVCARHGFILPNAVGDLQKGERHCNIDYIWASAYKHMSPDVPKIVSYDIACQWAPHLTERLKKLPEHLQIRIPEGTIRYAIPKYHFMGHKSLGHHQYSLNMILGVGRTDGEQVERTWSTHDGTAGSTREMGPGSRHDTLEDHFGWGNWLKKIGLGHLLRKRLAKAKEDVLVYRELYEDFKADVQQEHIVKWLSEVVRWEKDMGTNDPYDLVSSGPTETEIRAQLAAEEEQSSATEGANLRLHDISASGMVATLVDIEEQQRSLRAKFPGNASFTAAQSIEVSERRGVLRRRLTAIRAVQVIYMPVVSQLIAQRERTRLANAGNNDNSELIEREMLFLPHQLSRENLATCTPGLLDAEMRLREGQMRSALDSLRLFLHIKSRLVRFKARNVRHQVPNTRAHAKIEGNETKVITSAEKYRAAWRARQAGLGPGDWTKEWRELKQADVRCLQDDDDVQPRVSEGRRVISWIWMSADRRDGNNTTGITEALRIEFLKARARALRFAEEVQLLYEEQRRVLQALEHDALDWDRRGQLATHKEAPELREGAIAYAQRQAHLLRALQARFREMWTNIGVGRARNGPALVNDPAAAYERAVVQGIDDDELIQMPNSDDEDAFGPSKFDGDDDDL